MAEEKCKCGLPKDHEGECAILLGAQKNQTPTTIRVSAYPNDDRLSEHERAANSGWK